MSNNKRDFAFDVARSICIVEIVCMLHMTNYLEKSLISDSLAHLLGFWTLASLALFTFMSGYFMGRYKLSSIRDVYVFFVNRIKRFWGLYFVASLLLYVASSVAGQPWYESFPNFLLSLLGLTIFFQPLPPTLWYMVMLMFFYLITPLLLLFKTTIYRASIGVIILLLFVFMNQNAWVDNRVLLYFPFYVIGLCCNQRVVDVIKDNAAAILCVCIILILYHWLIDDSVSWGYLYMIIGGSVIITISSLLSTNKKVRYISARISFASMAMYFFHRHFYLASVIIWNVGNLHNVRNLTMPLWFCVLIVCPIIFIGSYYIQILYDSVLAKCTNRNV